MDNSKVGIVYDPIYLEHDTGAHCETAQRLVEIMGVLTNKGILNQVTRISPRPASVDELLTIHSKDHVARVERACRGGGAWLDADTIVSPMSYDAGLMAAGGLIEAVDAVMKGDVDNAFALVRPPGHHATRSAAMGFCLFNNVAIATRHAMSKHNLDRVLIADFDVHHGNGTQDAFYEDPHVLYFSTHQYPHYPGTGSVEETGRGAGQGSTVNVPLPGGCGDEEYLRVYSEILVPVAERFQPQLVMVSAGYDVHWADPLASMQLSTTGLAQITTIIKTMAERLCKGRLVFTLEGGYDLAAISQSVRGTIEALMGKTEIDDPLGKATMRWGAPNIESLLQNVKQTHSLA